jgi:hypothetical protein
MDKGETMNAIAEIVKAEELKRKGAYEQELRRRIYRNLSTDAQKQLWRVYMYLEAGPVGYYEECREARWTVLALLLNLTGQDHSDYEPSEVQ